MHFSMNVKYDGANINNIYIYIYNLRTCKTFQTSPNIIKF